MKYILKSIPPEEIQGVLNLIRRNALTFPQKRLQGSLSVGDSEACTWSRLQCMVGNGSDGDVVVCEGCQFVNKSMRTVEDVCQSSDGNLTCGVF